MCNLDQIEHLTAPPSKPPKSPKVSKHSSPLPLSFSISLSHIQEHQRKGRKYVILLRPHTPPPTHAPHTGPPAVPCPVAPQQPPLAHPERVLPHRPQRLLAAATAKGTTGARARGRGRPILLLRSLHQRQCGRRPSAGGTGGARGKKRGGGGGGGQFGGPPLPPCRPR
jgi:hypothetical protein